MLLLPLQNSLHTSSLQRGILFHFNCSLATLYHGCKLCSCGRWIAARSVSLGWHIAMLPQQFFFTTSFLPQLIREFSVFRLCFQKSLPLQASLPQKASWTFMSPLPIRKRKLGSKLQNSKSHEQKFVADTVTWLVYLSVSSASARLRDYIIEIPALHEQHAATCFLARFIPK